MATEAKPGQLVVHLKWTEGNGTPRQEIFGPWTPADDDSHLERIMTFMRDWNRLVGDGAEDAVMVAVQDPDEWVRGRLTADLGPGGAAAREAPPPGTVSHRS